MKLREMYPNGLYTENSEEVYNRFRELLGDDFEEGDDDDGYLSSCDYLGLPIYEFLSLSAYNAASCYREATYLTNEEFFNISLEEDEGISIEYTAQGETQVEDSSKSVTTNYPFKQFDYVDCSELSDEQVQAVLDQMVECGASRFEELGDKSDNFHYLKWDEDGDTYFDCDTIVGWHEVPVSEIFKKSAYQACDVTIEVLQDNIDSATVGSLLDQLQKIKTSNSPDITMDQDGKTTFFFLAKGDAVSVDVTGKSAEEIDRIYNAANVLMNV